MSKNHLMIRKHTNYSGRWYTHVSVCGLVKRKIHYHSDRTPVTCKLCVKAHKAKEE